MSIFNHFQQLTLSTDQESALKKLEVFLNGSTQVFMLKGYAGSGKTTILKGLTKYIESLQKEFILLAPTGRAAKVLKDKTGQGLTIHRGIYNFKELETINHSSEDDAEHSFHYYFPINLTDTNQKVIIVDEASMVSSKEAKHELFTYGTSILLNDLLTFASLQSTETKIIFVGDPAQLPPFGDNHSWALDKSYFEKLGISTDEAEMKQVLRQNDNLIFKNAEIIRKTLEQNNRSELKFEFDKTSFIKMELVEIIETFTSLFPKPEIGDGVIVSFSNAQCYQYNLAIREKLFPDQKDIVAGDLLLINNNNYHTYSAELFNGDIAKVVSVNPNIVTQSAPVMCDVNGKKIRKTITLHFREITIRIPTHSDDIKCNIIDSHLNAIERDLTISEMKALYINFVMRFNNEQKERKEAGLPSFKVGSDEFKKALKSDSFYNALKVKYGYAITCHKAQGGEWDKVFVDYSFRVGLKNDPLRWCYTATTRGVNTVFAINPPYFDKFDKLTFSPIGAIGKLPNTALTFDNIVCSPFHNLLQHKCKSLKYWEIVEKLENTSYRIEKVESFDYLERYTIGKDDILIQLQANNKKTGHFIEKFSVITNVGNSIKEELENIFNEDCKYSFSISYSPSADFLSELYSRMQEGCSNLFIDITNVVEEKYFVNYYLKTDSVCSYIQFYHNGKGQLTTANPKTFDCEKDVKLESLILNLSQHAG